MEEILYDNPTWQRRFDKNVIKNDVFINKERAEKIAPRLTKLVEQKQGTKILVQFVEYDRWNDWSPRLISSYDWLIGIEELNPGQLLLNSQGGEMGHYHNVPIERGIDPNALTRMYNMTGEMPQLEQSERINLEGQFLMPQVLTVTSEIGEQLYHNPLLEEQVETFERQIIQKKEEKERLRPRRSICGYGPCVSI